MISYTLIRSQRKTTVLQISKNAEVLVRAPLHIPKAAIDKFVYSKQEWILKTLEAKKEQISKRAVFNLDYGSYLPLRGKDFPIIAKDGNYAGFDGESFYFPNGLTSDEIKYGMIRIYKDLAKQILTDKVKEYGMIMNLTPYDVKVNGAKTRWGSCSGKNSLNFSWLLILGDDSIIDYVVVHELSHIKEHNHSDRFWALVASVIPDYTERRNALKLLHSKLSVQNWD